MAEPETTTPSQADMEAGAAVIDAGSHAAAAEPDATKKRGAASRAIKDRAKSSGWELTDAQVDKLAGAVTGHLDELFDALPGDVAEAIRKMGGMDKLPEPLTPPAAPTGKGELPAEPPATPAQVQDPAPGGGRTAGAGAFARWFRGG